MVAAVVIAPLMGIDKKGGFEFIQEYTGYVSPGIFALFTMGFFWKRTTSKAALFALLGGVTFSIITKFIPTWTGLNDTMFYTAFADETGTMMIPFMDRMGWVFIFCIVSMVVITLSDPESKNNPQGLEIDAKMFKLSPTFIFGTVVICLFLTLVYTYFW
jgi:SSS family solute:Na+ symporter